MGETKQNIQVKCFTMFSYTNDVSVMFWYANEMSALFADTNEMHTIVAYINDDSIYNVYSYK